MNMKNKLFMFGIIVLVVLGSVLFISNESNNENNVVESKSIGTSANFYYSEKCLYCAKVFPLVKELSKQYSINFYNVDTGSYNIKGVPTAVIKTTDGREITLIGSEEILKYLKCELQEKSTKECPTLTRFNCERQSWFIKEWVGGQN